MLFQTVRKVAAMINKLKIYLPFAANELKRQLAYKGAFYLFVVISLFSSFISYFLWMAIYGSSGGDTLGGLSQNEMVVYVFMVYITTSIVNISISKEVGMDIVKGQVVMNLIKPIDYRMSLISKAFGNMVYRFFVPGIIIWIGLEIYKANVLGMGVTGIENILLYLLSCMMSFLIYVLFDFCFGMIGFFTTYIFGLEMIKESVLLFLTGQLIPLSFFPQAVQNIFSYLPFSSMVYTPVMIYLGKYTGAELIKVLIIQFVWVILLYLFGSLIWKRVTKRLIVLGG